MRPREKGGGFEKGNGFEKENDFENGGGFKKENDFGKENDFERKKTNSKFPGLVCAAEEETCVAVAARVCGRHLGCAEGHPQAPTIVVVT